jgi:SNF2 family DNA or RNA helicase
LRFQKIEEMTEFIVAFRKHRVLGYLATPYMVEMKNGQDFYTILDMVTPTKLNSLNYEFSPDEKKLVELMDKYSDHTLYKIMSKKDSPQSFFSSIDTNFFNQTLTPYIEKILIKCLDILKTANIKIFHHDQKFINLYPDSLLTFPENPAEAVFNFIKNGDDLKYFLTLKLNDEVFKLWKRKVVFLVNQPCYMILFNHIIYFEDIDSKKIQPFFEKDCIYIPPSAQQKYFETFISSTILKYTVKAEGFTINENFSNPKCKLELDFDLLGNPCLIAKYRYGKQEFLPNSVANNQIDLLKEGNNYTFVVSKRNLEWENKIDKILLGLGLVCGSKGIFKIVELNMHDPGLLYEMVNWINRNKQSLKENDIELTTQKLGRNIFTDEISIDLKVKQSNDWFDVFGMVRFGEFEFAFIKLRRHILRGIREFELPNGEIAILPKEWFTDYQSFFMFGQDHKQNLRMRKLHFSLFSPKLYANLSYVYNYEKLLKPEHIESVDIPEEINATLRPYQSEGVGWMDILRANFFGGCLADDMGLGKTLQTITLLTKAIKERNTVRENSQGKLELGKTDVDSSLIIMPSTLISNWFNEIKKFAPHLKVARYVGTERMLNVIKTADIVLTTYGIVRNDHEMLQHYNFYYIVLDESQFIKNVASKIYQAVTTLQSEHKLVLTGTPIENSLSDLWAQMNFVNRGILGTYPFFRDEFLNPIEKNKNEEKIEKLQTIIQPFILRRTKENVAKDLPALTMQTVYCEMSDEQRSYYETEKSRIRNFILDNYYSPNKQGASMMMLQSLIRLRQIANHPALIDHEFTADSGKYEEIIRNIDNLVKENHKVLVFSSFVRHLRLVENYLKENSIKYEMLTGEVRFEERGQIIDRFQQNPEVKLFLISLKAGGYGLNLTSADYVFILDPWWNVAAEMQAINRAHRIGQDKKVFVYRFISTDSIEEKILKLQETKSLLVDTFINNNNPFEKLNLDTLKSLLD